MADGMEDVELEADMEEMSAEGETPMAEEGEPAVAGPIHIPAAALGRQVRPGETITVRVVAADENGAQVEVVEAEESGGYEEAGAAFDRMATPMM